MLSKGGQLYSPAMGRRSGWKLLRRSFAGAPARVRLHVLGRFLSCPLAGIVARLPGRGRLLDIGAGHGAFALLATHGGGVDAAVALEPDVRKLLPTFRDPRVALVAGYDGAVAGRFAAVTVVDVLYRLPIAAWDGFLGGARDHVADGGVLLLKEIDPTHRLKGLWNRTQERIVDLLGLTLGEAHSYEAPAAMVARLERLGFTSVETVPLGAWYPHAHVLYVARRPERRERQDRPVAAPAG
jgi:hypothetical protein